MEKAGKEKTANLIHQGVQRRRKLSNSQHVELVIARIFSKQREYANLRVVRPFDLEDTESERNEPSGFELNVSSRARHSSGPTLFRTAGSMRKSRNTR
jgi:hypothetical protein